MTASQTNVKYYSPIEEGINISSHAIGLVLSLVGLGFLLHHAISDGTTKHIISFAVFGLSLALLYTASTIYHAVQKPKLRFRLKVFDHAAIYVLIAGTYTPFALITLENTTGWIIFGVAWSMAAVGIILKLFFTGRFTLISTAMYVLMGWMIVFAINPLLDNLASGGVRWLFLGGIIYTIGAIFYSIKKIPFNHAIFHLFVLAGSFCHFMAVFLYVLPHQA